MRPRIKHYLGHRFDKIRRISLIDMIRRSSQSNSNTRRGSGRDNSGESRGASFAPYSDAPYSETHRVSTTAHSESNVDSTLDPSALLSLRQDDPVFEESEADASTPKLRPDTIEVDDGIMEPVEEASAAQIAQM